MACTPATSIDLVKKNLASKTLNLWRQRFDFFFYATHTSTCNKGVFKILTPRIGLWLEYGDMKPPLVKMDCSAHDVVYSRSTCIANFVFIFFVQNRFFAPEDGWLAGKFRDLTIGLPAGRAYKPFLYRLSAWLWQKKCVCIFFFSKSRSQVSVIRFSWR